MTKKTLTESIRKDFNMVNEYFAQSGDSLYDAVCQLNVLTDGLKGQRPSEYYDDFAASPEWMNIEQTYYPRAVALAVQLKPYKKPISQSMADKIDNLVYDGGDSYDDVEEAIESLVEIYDTQIAFLEKLVSRMPTK